MCFLAFLKKTRNLLSWVPSNHKKLCVVMGNESCDLDSAVCALSFAFLQQMNKMATEFLPVLNIPRSEFALKTEVIYLFEKYGIKADEHLTFRDDLTPEQWANCRFMLVDHHVSQFPLRVDAVIDHRPFNPRGAQLPVTCSRIIERVGSCATLIAEQFLDDCKNPNHAQSELIFRLLLNTIILDTANLSLQASRATPKDFCIVNKLENLLKIDEAIKLSNRNGMFDDLLEARANVSGLSASQLMRKDLKMIQSLRLPSLIVAVPVFPILVQDFIERPHALQAVSEFATKNNVEFMVLLGMSVNRYDGTITRDLGLICIIHSNKHLYNQLHDALLACDKPKFELRPLYDLNFFDGIYYRQLNVRATRKDVLPIVKRIIDEF